MKVAKSEDLPSFELFGKVAAKVVLNTERMTLLFVELPEGTVVPVHSHPHEQCGIALKGEAEIGNGISVHRVKEGMFYHIPPNEKHGVKMVRGSGLFVDIFSPPREEYVEKQKKAVKRP